MVTLLRNILNNYIYGHDFLSADFQSAPWRKKSRVTKQLHFLDFLLKIIEFPNHIYKLIKIKIKRRMK